MSTAAPAASTTTSSGMELQKDSYIPVFTNRPADYREWRQRIQLYRRKLELQNKNKEAVLNVLTSLHGVARRQIETKVDVILAKEEGAFDMLITELDSLFRYNEDVEMPRAFEKFFYGMSRRPDQTLMAYVADHRQALHEVEKHGVQISDKVSGWILLRRVGLTQEQKQLIQSQCPKLSYDKVVDQMFYLLGQDYKGKTTIDLAKWRGKKIPSTSSRWSRSYGYTAEEIYDPDEAYDEENAYNQWDDEEAYGEWDEEEYDPEEDEEAYASYAHEEDLEFPDKQNPADAQLEEAYASYLDARRHFAQLKAARGYFPVVALTGNMDSPPARSQMPKGPGKGGKGGKGRGKGKGKPSRKGPPQKGTATERADATRCLKCLQVGHWAINCPNKPAKGSSPSSGTSSPTKRPKTESAMMVRDLTQPEQRGVPTLSEAGWYGMQDGGASSVVCGHTVLMSIIDHLRAKGVPLSRFLFANTNKTFGFGGDANRQADWSIRLPVYIQKQAGYVECFIVEGNTPLLIGRPILKALNIKVDYCNNSMSIRDEAWHPAVLGEKGEYLLRLDDGVDDDPHGEHIIFDYVTSETCSAISNYDDLDNYIGLQDYLVLTERSPPEIALLQDDTPQDQAEASAEADTMPEDEDPSIIRRDITDKMIKTMHMEFNSFNRRRQAQLEQGLRAHEKKQKIFWEVYSGSGNLSTVMESYGWLVQRFDYEEGWDFDISEHRRQFLKLQDEVCPDFIWYAPRCTEWSPMQNLNVYNEERREALDAERVYQEKVHLKLCRRSYVKQHNEGRHGAIEQPRFAASWRTPTFQTLPGQECWLDQCQFGVKLPNSYGTEMFVKKPTRLQCTDHGMAVELSWLCPGLHEHLPLEGSSPGIGSRTAAAATYQFVFCDYLAKAINNISEYGKVNAERALAILGELEHSADIRPMDMMSAAPPDEVDYPDDPAVQRGVLQRLQEQDRQAAKRTIMRLHRNLGHPTKKELIRLLKSKNASEQLLQAAEEHECGFCELHRRPSGVPASSMPKDVGFNDRVQMDTLWIHVPGLKHKQPVLMMSDAVTRLIAARHLQAETSQEFVRQIEQAWINFFGPMKVLQVDEHRAWSSDYIREWATEQGIQLVISPGQAPTRLAILERRHQVTRRAVSLFLESNPGVAKDKDGLMIALNYVVPQLNRTPNVHGFSPLQWVLGYTPHVPGLLTDEMSLHNPAHLEPGERFREKLRLQQEAAKATLDADIDQRLRRALLRKYSGQPVVLQPGDLCYYWRDTPAGHAYKLKWRGPATVIMREPGAHGPNTDTYWIGHGTVLLRAAPEHVKPARAAQDLTEQTKDPISSAKDALNNIRGRGVTQYVDLVKSNKWNRDEIDLDEELEELDEGPDTFPGDELPPDRWQVSEDQRLWTRIHNQPRRRLYVPEPTDDIPIHIFKADRVTDIRRGSPNPEHLRIRDEWRLPNANRELHYTWTGTTTFIIDVETLEQDDYSPMTPLDDDDDMQHREEGPESETPVTPTTEGESQPPTLQAGHREGYARLLDSLPEETPADQQPVSDSPLVSPSSNEPEPMEEPIVPSNIDINITIPEHQRQLYEAQPAETFAQQRARTQQQETLLFRPPSNTPDMQTTNTTAPTPDHLQEATTSPTIPYGPVRQTEQPRETPYSHKPLDDETVEMTMDVDVLNQAHLPGGWKSENGYVSLDNPKDEWIIEGNYLTRKHYLPRQESFEPTEDNCPLPLKYLRKDRYTKCNNQMVRDKWTRPSLNKKLQEAPWTGYTRFKIHTSYKKEAKQAYYDKSDGMETMYHNEDKTPTAPARPLSEKSLSIADRLTFMEAKKKELESFFQNSVWEIDDESNADPSRILRARFLLNWKKHPDGTPRAKARLVVQGFRDPDALQGNLSTTSPTLTRLSRNYILTIATMLGMTPFTSDITTAFLQGKNFDPASKRVIWVRLPPDGAKLLGLPFGHKKIMKLVKPMYGLCDAPRAWYQAATQKILEYGKGKVIQHPLNACLFLVFDKPVNTPPQAGDPEPQLLALFGMHVDDLFRCYRMNDKVTEDFISGLKSIFTFCEWITGDANTELEYCGAQITAISENHWKIHHQKYLNKQKPITYPKERHGSDDLVTERERTSLRGLIGALQWPSTQTSPHLQALTSTLAGQITKAKTSTLDQANKALRYAKENSDVGLEFRYLGDKNDITFVAYSDASFASRDDLSSQGGYMVAMTNKKVADGMEGHYNIIDWRSWKLARVARSTLSAESQAASEAADALLFATTFWNLIWQPWLPWDKLTTAQIPVQPRLVIDAKALYDLLIKEEVQAANNTDKRTAIEVLVTQDKLKCCDALTMWVSSELQYADGLTKGSVAQLLADRMRTHLTKLKSDENFTAAKKKTAKARQQNTQRYAIQKPGNAFATAMFASFCTPVTGMNALVPYTVDFDTFTFHILNYHGFADELPATIITYFIYLMVLVGMITTGRFVWNLFEKMIGLAKRSWRRETEVCYGTRQLNVDSFWVKALDHVVVRRLFSGRVSGHLAGGCLGSWRALPWFFAVAVQSWSRGSFFNHAPGCLTCFTCTKGFAPIRESCTDFHFPSIDDELTYRPWPKGLRTDSLPWFDSPLVQGASRLRYTDKAQVAATGPYWPKGARNKKNIDDELTGPGYIDQLACEQKKSYSLAKPRQISPTPLTMIGCTACTTNCLRRTWQMNTRLKSWSNATVAGKRATTRWGSFGNKPRIDWTVRKKRSSSEWDDVTSMPHDKVEYGMQATSAFVTALKVQSSAADIAHFV